MHHPCWTGPPGRSGSAGPVRLNVRLARTRAQPLRSVPFRRHSTLTQRPLTCPVSSCIVSCTCLRTRRAVDRCIDEDGEGDAAGWWICTGPKELHGRCAGASLDSRCRFVGVGRLTPITGYAEVAAAWASRDARKG